MAADPGHCRTFGDAEGRGPGDASRDCPDAADARQPMPASRPRSSGVDRRVLAAMPGCISCAIRSAKLRGHISGASAEVADQIDVIAGMLGWKSSKVGT